jgi:hypothetical protein
VTARPTSIVEDMLTEADPTCVHELPSAEQKPVNVLPLRVIFTHTGAVPLPHAVLGGTVDVVEPPADERTCQR